MMALMLNIHFEILGSVSDNLSLMDVNRLGHDVDNVVRGLSLMDWDGVGLLGVLLSGLDLEGELLGVFDVLTIQWLSC